MRVRLGLALLALCGCEPDADARARLDAGENEALDAAAMPDASRTSTDASTQVAPSLIPDEKTPDSSARDAFDASDPTAPRSPSSDGALEGGPPPGDAATPLDPPFPIPQLTWTRCGAVTLECSSIKVPRNYAEPSGPTIELPLRRVRAYGTSHGVLFVNPGGPGASAIDSLVGISELLHPDLHIHTEVVAVEPRGVSGPDRLDCHSTLQRLIATDKSPDDEEEWRAVDQAARDFADECARKHAALLPHLGTENVARDMELVRAALGHEQLSYLGFSYGTEIGAVYAELFPKRVRAMVLDGAVNMNQSVVELALEQGRGFDNAVRRYFAWCDGDPARCAWTGGVPALQRFSELSARIDREPLQARDGDRPAGPGELDIALLSCMYDGELGWSILSDALDAAAQGDGSALIELVDEYYGRDGDYPNSEEVFQAVSCTDWPQLSVAQLRSEAARFEREAPLFGLAALTSQLVCTHWGAKTKPLPAVRAQGAAPILVIGTTGDPATPYAWAEALSRQLESARLLTLEGQGHTAYGTGSACIDDIVDEYLSDGTLPESGTRCRPGAVAASLGLPLRALPAARRR